MKNFLFAFFICFFSCSKKPFEQLPITTSSIKAKAYYERAIKHLQVGEQIEKRKFLDSALFLDPDFAMALEFYDNPNLIKRKKDQKKAQSFLNNLTEEEKHILQIRDGYRSNNLDKALYHAEKLVSIRPSSFESFNWLGVVQSDRNEIKKAINSFKKAINLYEDNYVAYNYLTGHHIPSGERVMLPEEERDVQLGLEYSNQLIKIRPEEGFSYHFKANCYRMIGEFDKAMPLYETSINKRRGSSSEGTALLVSGHNYMFGGDFKTARERYAEAIKKSQTEMGELTINNYIVWSHIFEGDFSGAIKELLKIEKKLDNSKMSEEEILQSKASLSFQKFVFYAHSQMEKETKKALIDNKKQRKQRADILDEQSAFIDSKSMDAYMESWFHILFGRYNEAKNKLDELFSIVKEIKSPTAMYGYYGLKGMVELGEGNGERALKSFKLADKTNTYFLFQKALAYRSVGEKEKAKKILKDISNENFSYWELAIVKNQAKAVMEKI